MEFLCEKRGIDTIIYVFSILPFLGIYWLRQLGDSIYSVWQVFGMLLLVFFVASYYKKIVIDKFVLSLCIYEAMDLVVCAYYYGISFGRIVVSVTCMALTMLIQHNPNAVLKAIVVVGNLVIAINNISVFLKIGSDEDVFFIGGKNQFPMFILPITILTIVYLYQMGKKNNRIYLLFAIVSLVSILLTGSGTGIVLSVVTILLLLFSKQIKRTTPFIIFYFIVTITLLLLFEFLEDSKVWVEITELMNKDVSLTGRTTIWNRAMEIVKEKWLFGSGAGTILVKETSGRYINEAHNIVLEVLLDVGVVGLIVYVSYFTIALKRINMEDFCQKILFIGVFVMLMNGLTESICNSILLTVLLAFSYKFSNTNQLMKVSQ